MRARDRAGRVLAMPNQTPGAPARYGLTAADVERAAWAIDGAGRRYAGAAAINRTLRELGGAWAVLGAAYRLPPLRWIEDAVYRWFATHRRWFRRWGVTPECAAPGVDCD